MVKLKYENEINKLGCKCPPTNATPIVGVVPVFRACFSECSGKDSFLPPAIMKPRRKYHNEKHKCAGFALSMFDSYENCELFLRDILDGAKNFNDSIGDYIGEGLLDNEHGLCTKPNMDNGHFDLHEYDVKPTSNAFIKFTKVS